MKGNYIPILLAIQSKFIDVNEELSQGMTLLHLVSQIN